MKLKFGAVAALPLVLALAACGGSDDKDAAAANTASTVAPIAAPAGQQWVDTIKLTEDGGYLMGNPDAPVKLVEYASMTCSHCADFAEKAIPSLKEKYIAKGTVSLELRNFVRDPIDMTASLLTRCGGEGPYYPLTEQMLAQQQDWMTKLQSIGDAGFQRLQTLPPAQQFAEVAKAAGLDQFVQQRGVSSQKIAACLADEGAVNKLIEMNKVASEKHQITGTPMFLINGETVTDAGTWETLEPKLRAAGA